MKEVYTSGEIADGIRFNWNVFPSTRLEASQLLTPVGCLFTPLFKRDDSFQPIPVIDRGEYPLKCDNCKAYINPYIKLDRANGMWWCPYCEEKSFFPRDYSLPDRNCAQADLPTELRQNASTVEIHLPHDISRSLPDLKAYVFVFDTYQHIDELNGVSSFAALKNSISEIISELPVGTPISILSYGEVVEFHKPLHSSSTFITTADINAGSKNVSLFNAGSAAGVLKKLGLHSTNLAADWKNNQLVDSGYIFRIDRQNRDAIIDYIQAIKPKITDSFKPPRCTGLAAYVISVALSKHSNHNFLGRVLLFTGGPGTISPGNIVDISSGANNIRTHKDIADFNAPQFLSALKFFQTISLIAMGLSFENSESIISKSSTRETDFPLDATSPKWTFDLYAASLDQVGIYEMKSLALRTMGNIYLYDTFANEGFKEQLRYLLRESVKLNAQLTVKTSPKLKVSKLVGPGHSLPSSYQSEKFYDVHHQKISDHLSQFDSSSKKKNFTNQWFFNRITQDDTFAVFFEPECSRSVSELNLDGPKEFLIQFQLTFWDPESKTWKLRITSISRNSSLFYYAANKVKMSDGSYKLINSRSKIIKEKEMLAGFDQDAFIILLSRLLLDKIDSILGFEQFDSISKNIDKTLVRVLHNFGGLSVSKSLETGSNPYSNFLHDIIERYEINENFKKLPTLAHSLRKNPQLIKIFNSLPDETAFYHHWFMKFNCKKSEIVIEPNLFKISPDQITKVSLDSNSISDGSSDSSFVMDSIFHVVIYKNNADLKLHPSENAHLVYSKDESVKIALDFIETQGKRIPIPKFIVTQKNHSQARFLFSRLNRSDELTDRFQKLNVNSKPPKRGFFDRLLGWNDTESQGGSYGNLLTDEVNLAEYYEGLIQSVKNYVVEDDY